MLTFSSPSVAPSVAGWIGLLGAPLAEWFTGVSTKASDRPAGLELTRRQPATAAPESQTADDGAVRPLEAGLATDCGAARCSDLSSGISAYWPCERLNAFMLKMAAHGRCVNAAMMLGHRPYARLQLAAARHLADEDLRDLADELQAYFEAPPDAAAEMLQKASGVH